MAATELTHEEQESIETKLITAAQNLPSGSYQVKESVVTFRRPGVLEKYKGRVWANTKLREIGITDPENNEEELAIVVLFRFIGALSMGVSSITDSKGNRVTLTKDDGYTFVLEKYLEEDINKNGLSDDDYINELATVYNTWEKDSTPTEDELKKS